ncbi:MAG: hypothetical protein JRH18_10570 [Deltaproteobacteria bacterium]|nr:hypothetical protein [Deltaproteobacteria bacterium]MBW2152099.1 hypothetical protein [Deltaproteobacteria bacterium]
MLPSTAKDPNVNIPHIEKLGKNIHAGTKYLRFIDDRYFENAPMDELNKVLFTFARYNAGPAKRARLRKEAGKKQELLKTGGIKVINKVFIITMALCFALIFPEHSAGEYVIKEYEFIWHVATVGGVNIKIQKNPARLGVLLSGRGGKIATLFLEPIQAVSIGKVLVKAQHYHQQLVDSYKKQVKGFEKDIINTVPAGGHKVIFSLTEKGKKFEIRIMTPKIFSPVVLMQTDEALKVGKYLLDARKMAELVNQRVKL